MVREHFTIQDNVMQRTDVQFKKNLKSDDGFCYI